MVWVRGRVGADKEKKKKFKKGKGNYNAEWMRVVGGEGQAASNKGMVMILHGGNKGRKIEKIEGEGWTKGGNPAW
jgi:hypothetical protein